MSVVEQGTALLHAVDFLITHGLDDNLTVEVVIHTSDQDAFHAAPGRYDRGGTSQWKKQELYDGDNGTTVECVLYGPDLG